MTGDDAAHYNDTRRKEKSDFGTSYTMCCKESVAKTSKAVAKAPFGIEASKVPHGQRLSNLINCLSDKRSSTAAQISDKHNGTQASNCN
ncbi:hypothetical protein PCASD_16920 [Puccinia coronata f. sp. avenae]|uniref:Uncharacterized protein n=1 Tax=Puccinia coronata f. sp. avenae TaxID=200324 RepID=A0A2N5T4Z8_9BASI|nr:hypothetical protein PCASD_16920 [Puccinia coronata f. sp. avenae]